MPSLEDHYRAVTERHGYDPVDFDLGGVPARHLRRKFVAVDGREAVRSAPDRRTIVTTGVGMTGPPHAGTLGTILNAVLLQGAGLDVQLVLADLEPYHGGGDLDEIRDLVARYRSLALDLGFDPDQGTLRTQEEALDVMHTAHLLARYYRPDEGDYWPGAEPTEWERAVEAAYEANRESEGEGEGGDAEDGGPDPPTSEAADHHSAVLHGADFLHLLLKDEYEQVVIALGIDEHVLTPATRAFLADAPVEGTVAGLHARMIAGLGDHPKMAKSLPGSDVHLGMDPGTIRDRVTNPGDEYDRPAESVVYQMLCLASEYGPAELDRLHAACADGGEEWEATKREYADYLADLARRW